MFGYKICFYNTVDEINKYSIHYHINYLCQISSRQTVSIDDKIMKKKNVIDLKTKSFQVSKAKKVNILKTIMKTHHDVYWIVNVIVFINNTCCVEINEKQGNFYKRN